MDVTDPRGVLSPSWVINSVHWVLQAGEGVLSLSLSFPGGIKHPEGVLSQRGVNYSRLLMQPPWGC